MRTLLIALLVASSAFGQALFRAQNRAAVAVGITLGAHTVATGAGTFSTSGINSTGGSYIVLGFTCFCDTTLITLSDPTFSNTITKKREATTAGETAVIYEIVNPTVGANHVFTVTGANFGTLIPAVFNTVKTTAPYDQENGSTSGGTTIQPGSITPGENDELVVTVVEHLNNTGSNVTINSGFTIIEISNNVGGDHVGGGLAYIVQTTAAAVNPTWSSTGSNLTATVIASVKKAP